MSDTIFMIHGMWGGAWYWEKFRSVFEAKGYRCVAVTLPYHDMDPKRIHESCPLGHGRARMAGCRRVYQRLAHATEG